MKFLDSLGFLFYAHAASLTNLFGLQSAFLQQRFRSSLFLLFAHGNWSGGKTGKVQICKKGIKKAPREVGALIFHALFGCFSLVNQYCGQAATREDG